VIWEDDDTPNIVSNPSFEDGEYPWYPWAPFQGETNWEIASDYSYGGSYSAKAGPFEPPDERIKFETYAQWGRANPMPLPPRRFVLSAWLKIEGATDSARERGKGVAS